MKRLAEKVERIVIFISVGRNSNEVETLLVKLGHTSPLRAFMTTTHAPHLS